MIHQPAKAPADEGHATADTSLEAVEEALASVAADGGIDAAWDAMERALYADIGSIRRLQALLEAAQRDGRLTESQCQHLSGNLRKLISEDLPTDLLADAMGAMPDNGTPMAPPPEPAAAADVVGPGYRLRDRYQLEECVHQGRVNEVYRASDLVRAESGIEPVTVAVKLLGTCGRSNPSGRRALRRQAFCAQTLTHDNIVRVYDVDRAGDLSFMTMEWLAGGSLAEHLDRAQLGTAARSELARRVLLDAGAALAYAHERGVVHGDIKPGNLFLTDDGQVKLLDFGLSRDDGRTADRPPSFVTPEYASCEVLQGAEPEPADDVFALACVVYRILTGHRPFGLRSALEAEADGIELNAVAELSGSRREALKAALAYRREDRTASVEELVAGLSEARREPAPVRSRPAEVVVPGIPAPARFADEPSRRTKPAIWVRGPYGGSRWLWLVPPLAVILAAVMLGIGRFDTAWLKLDLWRNLPARVTERLESLNTPAPAAEQQTNVSGADDNDWSEIAIDDPDIVPLTPEPEPSPSSESEPAAVEPPNAAPPGTNGPQAPPVAAVDSPAPAPAEAAGPQAPPAAAAGSPATATAAGTLGFVSPRINVSESDPFLRLSIRAPAEHPGIPVRLSIASGSAEPGRDFVPLQREVTLAEGQTRTDILWPLVDDGHFEYVEEVVLRLESLNEAWVVDETETLVIIHDDDQR